MIEPNQPETPTVPRKHVPAPLLLRHRQDPMQTGWPGGGTPYGGDGIVPHIYTVAGRYGVASKVYSTGDEALMDSRENAEIMRNELAIMECIEARKRSTALLSWHIGPGDESLDSRTRDKLKMIGKSQGNRWDAEELAAKVSLILSRTPHLVKMFDSLMDAIWYGRSGTEQYWESGAIEGISNRTMMIRKWQPRHGDKWVFRYDDGSMEYDPDQIGIRIGPGYNVQKEFSDYAGNRYNKVEATMYGLAYFLDGAERKKIAMHKHMIEDGDFNHPIKAGNIHGVGIRSKVYWTWYAYSECLKLLLEYLERSALGIEIWRYPAHNPKAKAEATNAAQNRGAPGRSILMVPMPEGEQAPLFGVEHIEPGLQGADVLQNVLERFYGHKIKRYILGQTLTTEADATGMGSGVADAHQATYADIVRYDSLGLAETITQDIVRQIQLLNFPGSEGIYLKFSFDTESPQMQYKLDAYRQAWEMGAEIKTDDIFRTLGAARPNEDDDVLINPAFQQQPMMDMGQMMGDDPNGMGMDPEADPVGAQDMLAPVEQGQYFSPVTSQVRFPDDRTTERLPAIQRYAATTHPNPSKAQRKAGNFAKRQFNWNGFRVSIENEAGTRRRKDWPELKHAYGYIRGTTGNDGSHLDCIMGKVTDSDIVFVVDQAGPKNVRFDEHKVMLGFTNEKSAKQAYRDNYGTSKTCGTCTAMTIGQFKNWVNEGCQTKRVAGQVSKYSSDLNIPNDIAESMKKFGIKPKRKKRWDPEQSSFWSSVGDWDESKVNREETSHDGKRPGEFAPKTNNKGELQKGMFGEDFTPGTYGKDELDQLTGQTWHQKVTTAKSDDPKNERDFYKRPKQPVDASPENQTYESRIFEAFQDRLTNGESVDVSTQTRTTRFDPRHKDSLRLSKAGKLQLQRGKNWESIEFAPLHRLAASLGVEQPETDPSVSKRWEEREAKQNEKEEQWNRIANKHFEGDHEAFEDDLRKKIEKQIKETGDADRDAILNEYETEDPEQRQSRLFSAMAHSQEDIDTANATSRNGGAVGGHPVTIKYVKQYAKPGMAILDFGAGRHAKQAQELKAGGLNVTAYDFGKNSQRGLHDPKALNSQYDLVYASNVLNVQGSLSDLQTTIQEIAASVAPGGMFIGNLPDSPRKGAFDQMTPKTGAETVHKLLEKFIGPTQLNDGQTHPIYVATKGQTQKFSAMPDEQYSASMPTRSSKTGIGKQIGNAVYVHRKYTGSIPESERVKQACKGNENWDWDIAKITPDQISLIKSPDFDDADEPISGDSLVVRQDNSSKMVPQLDDPNIYHHKWLMVGDDYDGFDVDQSKRRSESWINLPVDKSKIGKKSYWDGNVIPLIQKYGAQGECDPNMKKNGKTTCEITQHMIKESCERFGISIDEII